MTTKATSASVVGDSVKRIQDELEEVVNRVRKGLESLEKRSETVDAIVRELRRVRNQVRTTADDVLKGAETRANRVLSRVESGASRFLEPIAKRFNVATVSDMEALRDRISVLEKRVEMLSKSAEAA